MAAEPIPARIPDLHRSAFWIYALTVTVIREAVYTVFHHAATLGWHDSTVQLEALRTLVVLVLLARQMLSAGMYFDRVYLQPDSGTNFPRRSYPIDFLFGLTELLTAVAASTTYSLPSFDACVAVNLSWVALWLGVSAALGYSTVRVIAPGLAVNAAILAILALVRATAGEAAAAIGLLILVTLHLGYYIYTYNRGQSSLQVTT